MSAPSAIGGSMAGYRVLELGSFIAGPYCARLFADHGAEVIKVEPPGTGDVMRSWGSAYKGLGLQWPVIARNKRSITLNLRTVEGRKLLLQLIETGDFDVIVENFRPGTLERWGLSPKVLEAASPATVLVRVSGYGQSGPKRDLASFGSIGEAVGGLRFIVGEEDGPPLRMGVSIGDMLAGSFAFMGALMALLRRDRAGGTGNGQVVDVALYEAVLAMTESMVPEFDKLGLVRQRTGSLLAGIAPSNAYPTLEGDWVLIAANADTVFRRFATAIGHSEWVTDERYSTHSARSRNQRELDQQISTWTKDHSLATILRTLEGASVPSSKVNRVDDIVADPHVLARNMVVSVPDATLDESVLMPGVVPVMSESPGTVRSGGPTLGEANSLVYEERLGLHPEHVAQLSDAGII